MRLILPPLERGVEPGWALCRNGHSQIIRLHVINYNKLHSMTCFLIPGFLRAGAKGGKSYSTAGAPPVHPPLLGGGRGGR